MYFEQRRPNFFHKRLTKYDDDDNDDDDNDDDDDDIDDDCGPL